MYRGYVKNLTNLTGESIGSPSLKIRNMTINRDLLTSTVSEFEMFYVPSAVEVGDIFGVYDDYGKVIYNGVVTSVENTVVRTNEIICIFDDIWLYHNPQLSTIEANIKKIIEDDFMDSNDEMVNSIFSQFNVVAATTHGYDIGLRSENFTINFKDWLIELYNEFGLQVNITVPYNAGTPTITISVPNYDTVEIANNTSVIKNFSHTAEVSETNRLIVYATNGAYRTSYYVTPSGITLHSDALDRVQKTKSKIVFSDLQDLTTVIDENLSDLIYNHKISFDMFIDNKLFDLNEMHLGQPFTIYWYDKTYHSILTGYQVISDSNGYIGYATLTFGKVRYSLDQKLQQDKKQLGMSSNVMNSQKWIKQYYDEEIGTIGTTIGEIQADINGIHTDVSNVEQTASEISSTVTSLSDNVEELSSELSQTADSINARFSEYVRTDDEDYVTLTTNIVFDVNGVNISSSSVDTNLQLAADGVYIRDAGSNNIATMTSTQFTTGDWVLQQSDYIFNIFKRH